MSAWQRLLCEASFWIQMEAEMDMWAEAASGFIKNREFSLWWLVPRSEMRESSEQADPGWFHCSLHICSVLFPEFFEPIPSPFIFRCIPVHHLTWLHMIPIKNPHHLSQTFLASLLQQYTFVDLSGALYTEGNQYYGADLGFSSFSGSRFIQPSPQGF